MVLLVSSGDSGLWVVAGIVSAVLLSVVTSVALHSNQCVLPAQQVHLFCFFLRYALFVGFLESSSSLHDVKM